MRFFGLILIIIGFLGAVVSLSVGVLETIAETPGVVGQGGGAATIFAILAGAAFVGGAVIFVGGVLARLLENERRQLGKLADVGQKVTDIIGGHKKTAASGEVVRLKESGPRDRAYRAAPRL